LGEVESLASNSDYSELDELDDIDDHVGDDDDELE